jgi:hypothetical protein
MTADEAVRVQRRFKELYEKNPNITLAEVKHRETWAISTAGLYRLDEAPGDQPAVSSGRRSDAGIVLDNSHLTMKQQGIGSDGCGESGCGWEAGAAGLDIKLLNFLSRIRWPG